MRSHSFLTPMSPDGTPGEIKHVIVDEGPRQFLEPVSPYAVNDVELSKLRTAVSDAETALRHAKSKNAGAAEITRLDKALTTAKRDLDIVEYELRRKRQREQVGADSPFARQTLAELVASTVAGVKAVVEKGKAPTRARDKVGDGWDAFLRAFDERQAKRALAALTPRPSEATHAVNTCCSGKYLCAKCKAKKAVAV